MLPNILQTCMVLETKDLPPSITSCTGQKLYCAKQNQQLIGTRISKEIFLEESVSVHVSQTRHVGKD